MNTSIKLKLALLSFFIVLAIVTIVPSFYAGTPAWWKQYMAPEGLRLGLDLQGGMHLVLKVNLEKAEENALELAANDLKDTLAEKSISAVQTIAKDKKTIIFTLPNASVVDNVRAIIEDGFKDDLDITVEAKEGSFPRIILALSKAKIDYIQNNAVAQSLEIIRNRIDQFGVAEPVILRQGTDEIVIQLPGIRDPERALKLLGDTAQLEFKIVAETEGINLDQLIAQARESGHWSGKWQDNDEVKKLNQFLGQRLAGKYGHLF